jgi:hypothetical protein
MKQSRGITAPSGDRLDCNQIADLVSQLSPKSRGNAADLQTQVANLLGSLGFQVRWEVPVSDRGDGKTGYLDLVARKDGFTVAIELDCVKPRKKSLMKLRAYRCDFRLVVLRRGAERIPDLFEGIDMVLRLGWPR